MNQEFKHVLCIILVCSGITITSAQNTLDPIATDRPDQTESTQLVPSGYFQYETGIKVEKEDNGRTKQTNYTFSTNLLKFGLSKHAELRLTMDYLGIKLNSTAEKSNNSITGFNSITIGSKIFIREEKRFLPNLSVITYLNLPYFGREEFRPDYLAPGFRFLANHNLNDRISISYNLGAEWDGKTPAPIGIYTLSSGFALVKNLNLFLELYGFVSESEYPDHRTDGGITYLINDNFQFDLSCGIGISEYSPDYFISSGISFRIAPVHHNLH